MQRLEAMDASPQRQIAELTLEEAVDASHVVLQNLPASLNTAGLGTSADVCLRAGSADAGVDTQVSRPIRVEVSMRGRVEGGVVLVAFSVPGIKRCQPVNASVNIPAMDLSAASAECAPASLVSRMQNDLAR